MSCEIVHMKELTEQEFKRFKCPFSCNDNFSAASKFCNIYNILSKNGQVNCQYVLAA